MRRARQWQRIERLEQLERLKRKSKDSCGGPFTAEEAASLVRRVAGRACLSTEEMERLERWGPVFHGEWLVRAGQGKLWAKQYVGVDLAEV